MITLEKERLLTHAANHYDFFDDDWAIGLLMNLWFVLCQKL